MDIIEFIESRLDAMLSHPLNWGGAEAYELQVLLLLELRQFARTPATTPSISLRLHLDAYSKFLRLSRPELGPRPLSAVSDDVESIAQRMQEFSASLTPTTIPSTIDFPAAPETLGEDVEVVAYQPTKPRAA